MGHLTRRSLLGSAFASGGALLAPGGITRALAAPPEGDVFELPVRGDGPIRAPRAFDLLGVEWDGPAGARIEVRAGRRGAGFGPWLVVPAGHGHGPDTERKTASSISDPVWTGPADVAELRSSRPLRGARLHLVAAEPMARAARLQLVTTELAAGPGQPPIVARGSWATPACRPRKPPYYGVMQVAFVHHTAGTNFYRRSDSAAIVRSICLFHRNVHGWNDIGYNFLVDRYGQIFEGRQGGIDEPLAAAHAGGYNLNSTGIALLGTFSGVSPTPAALDALGRLLAWKLALHGIDAGGASQVRVSRYGSVYSRYRAGTDVHLHNVAGHRDGDTTTCPGNVLYRRLPRIRARTASAQGPLSALSAQVVPGPSLSGVLTSNGQPLANAQIEVQRRVQKGRNTSENTIATATTGADGSWSIVPPLTTNATLRALYRGAAGLSAVVSPAVFVAVPTHVTLQVSSQQAAVGIPVVFSGTVAPVKDRVTLVVSQLQPDASYAQVRTVRVAVGSDGTFSRGVAFSAPGQYQVVARTDGDARNAPGASQPVAMTVV